MNYLLIQLIVQQVFSVFPLHQSVNKKKRTSIFFLYIILSSSQQKVVLFKFKGD